MGEARQKRKRYGQFLEEHPWCCYCGGTTTATTVDHVPSRQMFSGRRRPKGLEAPACAKCNNATRLHEQVAAMLARSYPDPSTPDKEREFTEILKAVANNNPGLFEEMQPSRRQTKQIARLGDALLLPPNISGALNCQGPLLNESIELFGAEMGLALHYSVARRIVPDTGGVAVKWYTNYDRLSGRRLPQELFRYLGSPETLQQGTWQVSDQFEYAYAIADTGRLAAYFSTFRQSFAVLSWVGEDVASFGNLDLKEIYRPGFLTLAPGTP